MRYTGGKTCTSCAIPGSPTSATRTSAPKSAAGRGPRARCDGGLGAGGPSAAAAASGLLSGKSRCAAWTGSCGCPCWVSTTTEASGIILAAASCIAAAASQPGSSRFWSVLAARSASWCGGAASCFSFSRISRTRWRAAVSWMAWVKACPSRRGAVGFGAQPLDVGEGAGLEGFQARQAAFQPDDGLLGRSWMSRVHPQFGAGCAVEGDGDAGAGRRPGGRRG